MDTTGICIVLYHPDLTHLKRCLTSYHKMADRVILVDNTPDKEIHQDLLNEFSVTYLALKENKGIAAAQNTGIAFLVKEGMQRILLLDQDSLLSQQSYNVLCATYEDLNKRDLKLGGVGPQAYNLYLNKPYEGRIFKGKLIDEGIKELNELISSGSLIPAEVFEDVEGFEESLFIDGVDHEWCWRAKLKGYRFFVATESKLEHKLGEGTRYIAGVNVSIPSPIRTYYQYRNYFRLAKRNYVPLFWKVSNLVKYILKIPYYSFYLKDGSSYFKYLTKGIKDGIFNSSKSSIND